ncbi:hypothetical protein [Phaeobacter gallaeciensis]|nr:hypothetical protein [Phaeobacter gallaeciensis]
MIELARAENLAMHRSWRASGAEPVRVRSRTKPKKQAISDRQHEKQVMEVAEEFAACRGVDLSEFLAGASSGGASPSCGLTSLRRECWRVLTEDHSVPQRIIAQVFGNRSATTISSGISLHRKQAGGKQ